MNKEYWQARWENNEILFHQELPNPFLRYYINYLDLKPGAKIFVPLCGKSLDMLWLATQGFQIIGNELSLKACHLFFAEHNLDYQQSQHEHYQVLQSKNITLYCGDFFNLSTEILGDYQAIYDRAALIALPVELRSEYAKKIISLTSPHMTMLLITLSYLPSQMDGPPFSVDALEIEELYGQAFAVEMMHAKPFLSIPEHLMAKGLHQAQELVVKLTRL